MGLLCVPSLVIAHVPSGIRGHVSSGISLIRLWRLRRRLLVQSQPIQQGLRDRGQLRLAAGVVARTMLPSADDKRGTLPRRPRAEHAALSSTQSYGTLSDGLEHLQARVRGAAPATAARLRVGEPHECREELRERELFVGVVVVGDAAAVCRGQRRSDQTRVGSVACAQGERA